MDSTKLVLLSCPRRDIFYTIVFDDHPEQNHPYEHDNRYEKPNTLEYKLEGTKDETPCH